MVSLIDEKTLNSPLAPAVRRREKLNGMIKANELRPGNKVMSANGESIMTVKRTEHNDDDIAVINKIVTLTGEELTFKTKEG